MFIGWLAIIALFFAWPGDTPPVSPEEKNKDFSAFLASREDAEKITNSDYFQINKEFVPGWWVKIQGEYVQVYEFPNEDTAKNFAAKITADGSTIGEQEIPWLGSPHFFKKEKVIVFYAGENKKTLTFLTAILDQQFAGK